jgi:hypothetical protein
MWAAGPDDLFLVGWRAVWAPPGGDPIVVGGGTVLRLGPAGPEPVLPADPALLGLDAPAAIADAWPAGDGFAYVLLNDSEGTPHVAQYDGARAGVIPLTWDPTREAAAQIEGHGTTVWARSAWHLYRYTHDPAIRFP